MNPENWAEIKRIFSEAADVPGEERRELLDNICPNSELRAEVEKLLAADEKADTLSGFAVPVFNGNSAIPEQIGGYRLLNQLGEGGMGSVFLAERIDLPRRVALKIVKHEFSSAEIRRRLHNERQILATLEHPNIARLIDGGTTERGLPFFVMEYVEGDDLLMFCLINRASVEDRLLLFRKICAAVSYAHGKLVVHRDLKPSNILVNPDGEPKLLDFGISKLLGEDSFNHPNTATALGMMTPNYASPEQFRGEAVSTATDVYSLGVLLFELLTGSLPYKIKDKRIDEMARAVCEIEPTAPSRALISDLKSTPAANFKDPSAQSEVPKFPILNPKLLQGDLDNIVLKALRKETSARYASVEQFSEDIRRHLEGKPVLARPATFGYRASKFIGRNRLTVVSASLGTTAAAAGVAATLWQSIQAKRQRNLAEKRFREVRQLARNVIFKYHDAIADLPGSTAARELLISDATIYLDNLSHETHGDLELEAELANAYLKIGDVQGRTFQANLGNSRGALANYRKSIDLFSKISDAEPRNASILRSMVLVWENYTLLCVRLGDWMTARDSAQRCLAAARLLIDLEPEKLDFQILFVRSYLAQGEAAEFSEGFPGQISIYREGLNYAADILRANPENQAVLRVYVTIAQRLGTQTEYWCDALREESEPEARINAELREAVSLHLETVARIREMKTAEPNNFNTHRSEAACINNVGSAYARLGEGGSSLQYTSEALEKFRRLAATDGNNKESRRDIADGLQYVGMSRAALGDLRGSIESYRAALEILEPLTATDAANFEFVEQTHHIFNRIGEAFLELRDFSEAGDAFLKGLRFIDDLPAEVQNYQTRVLQAVSLEKIGDAFRWLANNLPENCEKLRFFSDQSANYYRQSFDEFVKLEAQGNLSRAQFYKLARLEAKLRGL